MRIVDGNCLPPTGGRKALLAATFFVLLIPLQGFACSDDTLSIASDSLQQNTTLDSLKYQIFKPLLSPPRLPNCEYFAISPPFRKGTVRFRPFKIVEELIAAEGMGFVCMLPAAAVAGIFAPNDDEGWGGVIYGVVGMYAGYVLGTSFGVVMAGNDEYEQGSFLVTLSGSLIGTALGVGATYLLSERYPKGEGAVSLLVGPPIGAIVGFNLTRKVREPNSHAFLKYGSGKVSMSAGRVDPRNINGTTLLTVCVFQGTF